MSFCSSASLMRRFLCAATFIIAITPFTSWAEVSCTNLLARADSLANEFKLDSAIAVAKNAIECSKRSCGGDDTLTARMLHHLGTFQLDDGKYAESESSLKSALIIRMKLLDSLHPDMLASLFMNARIAAIQAKYEVAESLYVHVLNIDQQVFGKQHPYVALDLNNLASVYFELGQFKLAESLFSISASIREDQLGQNHPDLAMSLMGLANCCRDQAQYEKAESLYRRALRIYKANFGLSHPEVARTMSNLSHSLAYQGRLSEAEAYTDSALSIRQQVLGDAHPDVAFSLSNLAAMKQLAGKYDDVASLYLKAIAIDESALGKEHWRVAVHYHNLGMYYGTIGKYDQELLTLEKAMSIYVKNFGVEHPYVASCLRDISQTYLRQGRFSDASVSSEKSKVLRELLLGSEHPDFADICQLDALVLRAEDSVLPAASLMLQAHNILMKCYYENAYALPERDALTFSKSVRHALDCFFTCYFELQQKRDLFVYDGARVVINTKGISSEITFDRRNALETMCDPKSLSKVTLLLNTRFRMAKLFASSAEENTKGEYKHQLDSLAHHASLLEAELAQTDSAYARYKSFQNISLEQIQSQLPPNSVLLEYFRYNHIAKTSGELVPHYAVLCISSDAESNIIDLGEAESIDNRIAAYRSVLLNISQQGHMPTKNQSTELNAICKKLYSSLVLPIEQFLEDKRWLFVSPEGALNLISFSSLLSENERYLVEDHVIQYLSAGRDLIRFGVRDESGHGTLILADPDFNASFETVSASIDSSGHSLTSVETGHKTSAPRSSCLELGTLNIPPLPHTRTEAMTVAASASGIGLTITLLGFEANERRFKEEASGKRVIHLATHGYYLNDQCSHDRKQSTYEDDLQFRSENPLLLSGLLLAGVNSANVQNDTDPEDDGILSALEISGMNLRGTNLVVLSACETGLGDIKEGEGVFGLRRAFQLAGARTVVSALWDVDDRMTANVIGMLYVNSNHTLAERLQTMQVTQIARLRKARLPNNPFTWGAFITQGDWK